MSNGRIEGWGRRRRVLAGRRWLLWILTIWILILLLWVPVTRHHVLWVVRVIAIVLGGIAGVIGRVVALLWLLLLIIPLLLRSSVSFVRILHMVMTIVIVLSLWHALWRHSGWIACPV